MAMGLGIGGVIGAVTFSLFLIRRPTPGKALFAFFVQGIAIAIIAAAGSQWQVMALMIMVGISSTAISVIWPSVKQQIVPPTLMGRVSSVSEMLAMGSTPFAQAGAGLVVNATGPHSIYFYGGLLEVMAAGVALMVPAVRAYGKRANVHEMQDTSVL